MQTTAGRSRSRVAWLVALIPTLLLLAACGGGPRSAVDLAPFKAMARDGGCTDVRNRLFLIDDSLVFWDRAGNCADAAYGEALYGRTPEQTLCVFHDSIAGPVNKCQDPAYQELFDTINANLDKPDLELGAEHTVQQVRF